MVEREKDIAMLQETCSKEKAKQHSWQTGLLLTLCTVIVALGFSAFAVPGATPSSSEPRMTPTSFAALSAKDWPSLLFSMKPIRVTPLIAGHCIVNSPTTVSDETPAERGKGKAIALTVRTLLLEHPEKGNFLVDTGLDASVQKTPRGRLRGTGVEDFLRHITWRQRPGESLREQLESRKISPAGILYTHLHFDHVAGTRDLPVAKLYIAGLGEKNYNTPNVFEGDYLNDVPEILLIDFAKSLKLAPFSGVVDLFGDRSILALSTSGHTQGSVSFLLRDKDGWLLFLGDTVQELEPGVLSPSITFSENVDEAAETANHINTFLRAFPNIRAICTHTAVRGERE